MIRRQPRNTFIAIFCLIFLGGCGLSSEIQATDTAIVASEITAGGARIPTDTNTPTRILTVTYTPSVTHTKAATPTSTPKPTKALTRTPKPTPTAISYDNLPPLSGLAISESDFPADDPNFEYFFPATFQIDNSEAVNVANVSSLYCQVNCAKLYWGFETIVMTLEQYENSELAYQTFETVRNDYREDEKFLGECYGLPHPINEQWMGTFLEELNYVIFKLVSVRGPIKLTLTYPFWVRGHDLDAAYYCSALEHISNFQLQKIEDIAITTP